MGAGRRSHLGFAPIGLASFAIASFAIALVLLIVVATGNAARVLLLGGLAWAGLGLVALLPGRVRWARLGRRNAALIVATGLIAALVGGAMSVQATPTTAAAPRSAVGHGTSDTTPSPDTSPSPDAFPTPTPDVAVTNSVAGPSISPVKAGTALAALGTLAVKGRAPKTGYDRALFGQAWADVDRNGCDTRNDVLRRDLTAYVIKAGTHGCLVLSGTLQDPYTATTIAFVRGQGTSAKVQIDHVVALSDAWQKGAQLLSADTRRAFANDSLNLLAVDGPANQGKGDGDAATWLPPNKPYRCPYAARQVAVKVKFGLWVTSAERDALARILATCPLQPLPTGAAFVLGGRSGTSAAPAPVAPATAKPVARQPLAPPAPSSTDPRFDTCKAAKAAGYGPYYQGRDPEYEWYRDADHDGIVCE